jgi:hypothetical protein
MNICPHFYSHIELPTKLKHVIPHFSLCMDCIHYCLQYLLPSKRGENKDPQPIKVLTNHLSKLKKPRDNRLIAHDIIVSN